MMIMMMMMIERKTNSFLVIVIIICVNSLNLKEFVPEYDEIMLDNLHFIKETLAHCFMVNLV
jgi:hypothetical protein